MTIDKTNLAIIKHLRDGRKSYQKIASELALSENTIRTRVQKLMEEGILDINGVINPELMDGIAWWSWGLSCKVWTWSIRAKNSAN